MRRVLLGLAIALVAAGIVTGVLVEGDEPEKGPEQARQAPNTAFERAPAAIDAPKRGLSAEPQDNDGDDTADGGADTPEAPDEDEADGEGYEDEADGEGYEDEADGGTAASFQAKTRVAVRLVARRRRAKGLFRVAILNANGFDVRGTLTGTIANGIGGRQRRIKLTAKPFRVGANAKKTVTLKPPKKLRRLIRRKETVTLIARVEDSAGNTRTVKKKVSGS